MKKYILEVPALRHIFKLSKGNELAVEKVIFNDRFTENFPNSNVYMALKN